MRNIKETNSISAFLDTTVFSNSNKSSRLGFVLKQSTIFSFWNNIVGAKFAHFTKPYTIKYSKLYVSTKSPVIAQELSLYKNKILKNINSYSLPLNIEIKDIIFNYKNFAQSNPLETKIVEDKPVWFKDETIENVEIDDSIKEEISKYIGKIKFLNDEQKKVFVKKIISTYKAKTIQSNSKNH